MLASISALILAAVLLAAMIGFANEDSSEESRAWCFIITIISITIMAIILGVA